MILHPAVIALLGGSLLVCLMTLHAVWHGVLILKHWDLTSGSENQLALEKKTYLISTLMVYACIFLIVSLFLFIYTAEDLHRLFVGAMCAAGTLNVNAYGYPALLLKILNCLLAGVWLVLNYVDNRACDYPLIRKKYILLVAIAPLIVGDTVLQGLYFLNLKANVITSCCGSLFSADAIGVAPGLAALPIRPMIVFFFGLMALILLSGVHFAVSDRRGSGRLYALATTAALPVSAAALIAFISCYFYELPTHHCPFCILQAEYGYAGYLIYTVVLVGSVSGIGVGLLMPFRSMVTLQPIIPGLQRRLATLGAVLYGILTLLVAYRMVFTDFRLIGY